MIKKKNIIFLFCLLLGSICYASFPVESETIIKNMDASEPKFDLLAFFAGIFTFWTLPYSLLILFLIKRKYIRRSIIYGWIVGILIFATLLLLFFVDFFRSGTIMIY